MTLGGLIQMQSFVQKSLTLLGGYSYFLKLVT